MASRCPSVMLLERPSCDAFIEGIAGHVQVSIFWLPSEVPPHNLAMLVFCMGILILRDQGRHKEISAPVLPMDRLH